MGNQLSHLLVPDVGQGNTEQGGSVLQGAYDVSTQGGNGDVAGSLSPTSKPPLVDEILKYLEGLTKNYRAIQQDTYQKATPGTGSWFISSKEFQEWLEKAACVLWGSGIPGAGKTILASIVIRHLQDLAKRSPDISVAFAYCQYSNAVSVVEILASLVKQQAERSSDVALLVASALAQHYHEKTNPSQQEYLALLKDISTRFRVTFYVLDGLDESKADVQFDLLEALSSIKAHFFITSRPLKVLQEEFKPVLRDVKFVEIASQDQDIKLLVDQRVDRTPIFRRMLEQHKVREEIIGAIVKSSRGMILHASLQIEVLRHCLTVKDIRAKLKRFPAKLEDMYAHTLKRIEQQDQDQAKLAIKALSWLIYSHRSLPVADVRLGLSITLETEVLDEVSQISQDLLVSVCCGLVTVEEQTGVVRLVHYTARDPLKLLLVERCPQPHVMIAEACMASVKLYQPLLQPPLEEEVLWRNPLLEYAVSATGYHLREGIKTAPDLPQQVLQFLRRVQHFPYHYPCGRPIRTIRPLLDLNPLQMATVLGLPLPVIQLVTKDNVDANEPALTPLMIACHEGYEDVVEALLGLPQIQVDKKDERGCAALTYAIRSNSANPDAIINRLLDTPGVDINAREDCGCYPLRHAVHCRLPDIVQRLLDSPDIMVNPDDPNCYSASFLGDGHGIGGTPLSIAINEGGDIQLVDMLLSVPGLHYNQVDSYGWTSLMYAVARGYDHIVQRLLALPGIQINQISNKGMTAKDPVLRIKTDCGGQTALSVAAIKGHETIVIMLLAFPGIHVHTMDAHGQTALAHAARSGVYGLFRPLEDAIYNPAHAASQVDYPRGNPLVLCSKCHSRESIQPMLVAAAIGGNPDIVRRLLDIPEYKAEVNEVDGNDWSPLIHATSKGFDEVAQLLLEIPGIDTDTHWQAPTRGALQLAARSGATGAFSKLLDLLFVRATEGDLQAAIDLALQGACEKGHEDVVKVLLDVPGIDVNAEVVDTFIYNNLVTPLMLASRHGHAGVVRLLLDAPGIDPHMLTRDMRTAMWVATPECRAVFKEKGVDGREPIRRMLEICRSPRRSSDDGVQEQDIRA